MVIKLATIEQIKRFPVIASDYKSDILLSHDKYTVDGTSLMGIISLNLSTPVEIKVIEKCEGDKDRLFAQLKQEGFDVREEN